jgi:hypothetical protein
MDTATLQETNFGADFGLDVFVGTVARTHNSTYKNLAVQWLNEVLCFESSSVVADSFRFQNRQLLLAANR